MADSSKKITTYDLVVVGVMAAICFVVTYFFKIGPIPTPTGPTQIKLGNAFCLLAGLLFGGVRGGLAAGIGSMFFDLTNPAYISSAPFTLVFFFAMGFICGVISHAGGAKGENLVRNIIASASGAIAYLILNVGKSVVVMMLAGSSCPAAVVGNVTKLVTSGINAVVAVVVAVPLAAACRKGLVRAGLQEKLIG